MRMIVNWVVANKLYILLGLAATFHYFWLYQFKKKLKINDLSALIIGVLVVVFSLLSAKLFAFLETGGKGMSLYGGVFFLPIIYYVGAKITKRDVADVFDIFTICTIFTAMCARVNCLFAGCCLGKPFFGSDVLRWPTRQMELVLYLVMLAWLGKEVVKKQNKGKIYPMYMMTYGTFRFITEWLRVTDNTVGFLHISHIWSIVAIVVGWIVYRKLDQKVNSGSIKRSVQTMRKKKEEER